MLRRVMMAVASGPPPAGAPVLLSVTGSAFAFGTANNQAMPATVNAGDLLIEVMTSNGSAGNSVVNTPSGWTAMGDLRGGTAPRLTVFRKIAVGTEGGTTVNFNSVGNTEGAGQCFRIAAGTYSSTPELNTLLSNNSGASHPVNTSSPSWGAQNTLFMVVAGFGSSSVSVTGYPYPTDASTQSGGQVVSSCSRAELTAMLSPGSFTTGTSAASVTGVVSIRPV